MREYKKLTIEIEKKFDWIFKPNSKEKGLSKGISRKCFFWFYPFSTFREKSFGSAKMQFFKENDNTLKFAKHVSTKTSVIFS